MSFTFAFLFKYEINKSPTCEVKEIINVMIVNRIKLRFVKYAVKNGIKHNENMKEPMDPEIVFFGLIFDNFLPLKILPTIKPPVSDTILLKKYLLR